MQQISLKFVTEKVVYKITKNINNKTKKQNSPSLSWSFQTAACFMLCLLELQSENSILNQNKFNIF